MVAEMQRFPFKINTKAHNQRRNELRTQHNLHNTTKQPKTAQNTIHYPISFPPLQNCLGFSYFKEVHKPLLLGRLVQSYARGDDAAAAVASAPKHTTINMSQIV
jgi:hypothetical protein